MAARERHLHKTQLISSFSHLQHYGAVQYWLRRRGGKTPVVKTENPIAGITNMQTTISNQVFGGVAALAFSLVAFAVTAL